MVSELCAKAPISLMPAMGAISKGLCALNIVRIDTLFARQVVKPRESIEGQFIEMLTN